MAHISQKQVLLGMRVNKMHVVMLKQMAKKLRVSRAHVNRKAIESMYQLVMNKYDRNA